MALGSGREMNIVVPWPAELPGARAIPVQSMRTSAGAAPRPAVGAPRLPRPVPALRCRCRGCWDRDPDRAATAPQRHGRIDAPATRCRAEAPADVTPCTARAVPRFTLGIQRAVVGDVPLLARRSARCRRRPQGTVLLREGDPLLSGDTATGRCARRRSTTPRGLGRPPRCSLQLLVGGRVDTASIGRPQRRAFLVVPVGDLFQIAAVRIAHQISAAGASD